MQYIVLFVVIALLLALVWYAVKAARSNTPRRLVTPSLHHFELHICPAEFRFIYIHAQSLTIHDRAQGVSLTESATRATALLPALDALLASNFVLKAPTPSSELAFSEQAMRRESIHIRIAYTGQSVWQTLFAPDKLPPAIDALVKGVRRLAVDFVQRQTAAHSTQTTPAPDAVVAQVNVDLAGMIYSDGSRVSLNELTHELNSLPRGEGEIWFHRESSWQHETTPEAEDTSHVVLERLLEQRFLVRMFGADPNP